MHNKVFVRIFNLRGYLRLKFKNSIFHFSFVKISIYMSMIVFVFFGWDFLCGLNLWGREGLSGVCLWVTEMG